MKRVLPVLAMTLLAACQTLGLTSSSDKAAMAPPPAPAVAPAPPAPPKPTVAVADGWTTVTAKGAKVAAGYFTAGNAGAADDKLIAASSPRAGKVELQEADAKAKTKSHALKDGVVVPAGGAIEFKQGGMRLAFMDLKGPFVEGETIPVKLTFEKAGDVDATLTVQKAK